MILETIAVQTAQPAVTVKKGQEVYQLPAGQGIRVQTGPPEVDQLEEVCPAGKVWTVTVMVRIDEESDA